MERKNTKLRQAFEQIEKQELESLPEEEQVVRAFSENFTQQMKKLLENTSVDSKAAVKRRKIKWSALVAAVLMCMLVIGVSAGEMIPVFSDKWRERTIENIQNADSGEEVETFDQEYEKSTDLFSAIGRNQEVGGGCIILDYSKSIGYDGVAEKDEDYRFELKSVTGGRKKHLVMTGGKLSDGSATYEWTISDAYFAIIEISRCDGKELTSEEKDCLNFSWNYLIAGYSPSLTNLHFRGRECIRRYDDNKIYYAIEITEMIPFAKNDFALMAVDIFDYDDRDVNKDTLYADEEGALKLVNEDKYFGVLLRFKVPDEYASEDEHYAEKYFDLKPRNLKNWMKSYQTNATE